MIRKGTISSWKRTNTRFKTYTDYRKKTYSTNFTVAENKFCVGLHYNGADSYLFVNGKEIVKFIAKDSAIVATPLCLGNTSKSGQ